MKWHKRYPLVEHRSPSSGEGAARRAGVVAVLFLLFMPFSLPADDCDIRGTTDEAPALCGDAIQGGFLYGESNWHVNDFGSGIFILPIGMDAPDKLSVEFCKERGKNCQTFSYKVMQRKYSEQHITVAPKFVEWPKETADRIARENTQIRASRDGRDMTMTGFLDFRHPLRGNWSTTSPYGARRVFNGEPKNPHNGWDIGAPAGTDVHAIADGRVVLTIDAYLPGKTVIIDHGYGIFSIYIHLDKIKTKPGDKVSHDTVIGTVGNTGRSSGPHLHLGLYHNQVALDPELLFKD